MRSNLLSIHVSTLQYLLPSIITATAKHHSPQPFARRDPPPEPTVHVAGSSLFFLFHCLIMTRTPFFLTFFLLVCFFFLLVLFLQPTDGLGSATTVAIVGNSSSPVVCAILAGVNPRSVVCSRVIRRSDQPHPVDISLLPKTNFVAISGGRDFLCGLRSVTRAIFCWSPTTNFTTRRIYFGPTSFQSLAVGEDHVAAASELGGVSFWRGGGSFPANSTGSFKSLTSGNGFSCGINTVNNRVTCWGNRSNSTVSERLESEFQNYSMSTLFAGDSHMCGIDTSGFLICRGRNDSSQLGTSNPSDPYEFLMAEGKKRFQPIGHTCGITRATGVVSCWGQGSGGEVYFPIGNTSMEVIVASESLTCGVTTQNFSVLCWRSEMSFLIPLPQILPGVCTRGNGASDGENSCNCGVFPDSQRLCSDSGVICKPCGLPSPTLSPQPPLHPRSPPSPTMSCKGLLSFGIIGSVGILAGIISVLYFLIIKGSKRKKVDNSVQPTITGANPSSPPPALITPFSSKGMAMRRKRIGSSSLRNDRVEEFTLKELAEATVNFSPGMKIGAGSFGTVYKGKLGDGREVAIKRSGSSPRTNRYQEKETAFRSELETLSRLHHKHLVKLVGFCSESDERLLIYEYMKNGSLHDHLHSTTTSPTLLSSSWKARLKALLDAARGIDYLHSYAVPSVIHRDIKSSNILLDSDWTAKVSDLGLSVDLDKVPADAPMTNPAGTVGYIDPDYHVSVKSDVYGLGVVMLEVITGKRAVFRAGNIPVSVVDYALPFVLGGDLRSVVDERLGLAGGWEVEAVEIVAYTAVHCLRVEGKERPWMSDVVVSLENALGVCERNNGSFSSETFSVTSFDL